jgi:hypothetical protein
MFEDIGDLKDLFGAEIQLLDVIFDNGAGEMHTHIE